MNLTRIYSLSAAQWAWMGEAWLRLIRVRACLHWADAGWLRARLSLRTRTSKSSEFTHSSRADEFAQMHESVRLAARLHGGSVACLPRSLVLTEMLQRRGHAAHTVIGVAKHSAGIASHAWVEVSGQPVSEPESLSQEFSRLIEDTNNL